MSDHPSTFRGDSEHTGTIAWDDRATLHAVGDNNTVLDGAKGLRSGTFAELIRHLMMLPEAERAAYYIEKAGDREYRGAEIAQLAARSDFPQS